MKTASRRLLPTVGALALALTALADEPAPKATDESATAKAKPAKESAYLGVGLAELPELLREHLNLPEGVGIAITHVAKGSPAEAAGLQARDILTALDDQTIVNAAQLRTLITTKGIGREITLGLLRKGKEQKLKATLAKGTEEWQQAQNAPKPLQLRQGQWTPLPAPNLGDGLGRGFGFGGALKPEQLQELLRNFNGEGLPEDLQKQLREGKLGGGLFFFGGPGKGLDFPFPAKGGIEAYSIQSNTSTLSDNTGTYKLSQKEGKQHFNAKDKDGNELFDGIVDEKSRNQLPEPLLKKLEQLERIGKSGGKLKFGGLGLDIEGEIDIAPAKPKAGKNPAEKNLPKKE